MPTYNVAVRRTHPMPEAEVHIQVRDAKDAWEALRAGIKEAKKTENFKGIEPEDMFFWIVPVAPPKPVVMAQSALC